MDIIESSGATIIFAIDDIPQSIITDAEIIDFQTTSLIIETNLGKEPNESYLIKDNEVYYIIYTSGSTGKPKGVQITLANLHSFINWSVDLCKITSDKHYTFMNQAPFSFDLSVMDLYLSLATGGTLFSIDKKMTGNTKELFEYFRNSDIEVWVSTPSFADICLADDSFNKTLIPRIKMFLFCGETLTNKTVSGLLSNFHGADIINFYGPTEATVAVTSVHIDEEINQKEHPLPVGEVKIGCSILILDKLGNTMADCEKGEIVITGDSVSIGYYNNKSMTDKSFFKYKIGDNTQPAYRTGDEGYLKNGMLYYSGRIDFQIKLNGYRIEIEDIENNLRLISDVSNAIVIPSYADGKVTHLIAFVILKDSSADKSLKASIVLKKELKALIPEYMVPKKIVFKDSFPMNSNGKIDRKSLSNEAK